MATNFPTSQDSFTNPSSGSSLSSPSHSQQHSDVNDAVEALEAKVGVDGSTVSSSLDYRVAALEQTSGRRNLLYNGAMQVAQRGTSVTGITDINYRTADRWRLAPISIGTYTNSIENDAPSGSGFAKSFKVLCTTADASPAAGDLLLVDQFLEGQDCQSIKKGTSAAEQLTLSFWVKSNVAGTYVAQLVDEDNNRVVSYAYTISSSGTWEQKVITFPADTSGALDNDNNASLRPVFWLAAGSTYTSGTLDSVWADGSTTGNRAAGQTNLASAVNNYWQVTGVQLEVGDKATPFEHRSYGEELALCQRYFERVNYGNNNIVLGMGLFYQTTLCVCELTWKTLKRADPTITLPPVGDSEVLVNQAALAVSSVVVSPSKPTSATVTVTTTQSHAAGYPGIYRMDGSSYSIEAEL